MANGAKSKIMDLNMLVMTGGKERPPSDYPALFEKMDFGSKKFIRLHRFKLSKP